MVGLIKQVLLVVVIVALAGCARAAPKPQTKCQKFQALGGDDSQIEATGNYVPKCDKKGDYALVQSNPAKGFFWCANREGIMQTPRTNTAPSDSGCRLVRDCGINGGTPDCIKWSGEQAKAEGVV